MGKKVSPEKEDSSCYLESRNFDRQENGVGQYNENKRSQYNVRREQNGKNGKGIKLWSSQIATKTTTKQKERGIAVDKDLKEYVRVKRLGVDL